MGKIAVISDAHGNIFATQKVLESIKLRGIETIFCLGDLVAKGAHPDETINLIKKNCKVVLKGNCDEVVTVYPTTKEHYWNKRHISEENIEYLKKLPVFHEMYISGQKVRFFHASPNSLEKSIDYHHLVVDIDEKAEEMFENAYELGLDENDSKPDVVVFGHLHTPFVYRHSSKSRTLINSGSISNSCELIEKNGKKYVIASYLILEGKINSKEEADFEFEYVKIPYDYEKEIEALENSDMPNRDKAIAELKTGIYIRR